MQQQKQKTLLFCSALFLSLSFFSLTTLVSFLCFKKVNKYMQIEIYVEIGGLWGHSEISIEKLIYGVLKQKKFIGIPCHLKQLVTYLQISSPLLGLVSDTIGDTCQYRWWSSISIGLLSVYLSYHFFPHIMYNISLLYQ